MMLRGGHPSKFAGPKESHDCSVPDVARPLVGDVASRETMIDLAAVALIWCFALAILRALQAMGYPVGINVGPIGEDWVWRAHLLQENGSAVARGYWQIDGRNPLIAWWYVAVRPVLVNWENGFLVLKHVSRLSLAIASYLAITAVVGRHGRASALALAFLISTFSASGYVDNLLWAVIGVSAAALTCVWCFAKYKQNGRAAAHWLAASLVLWLVVLGSYTLQSGALILLGLTSLWHASRERDGVGRALLRGVGDIAPYVAILALFVLIWRSTAIGFMANMIDGAGVSLDALARSVSAGVWHPDYETFLTWYGKPLRGYTRLVVLLTFTAGIAAVLTWRLRGDLAVPSLSISGVILVGAIGIAAPTIFVETVSSDVWFPGSRWRMLHPYWVPSITVVAVGLFAASLPIRGMLRAYAWIGVISLSASVLFLVSLGHNHAQVRHSEAERALAVGLKALSREELSKGLSSLTFIVKNESTLSIGLAIMRDQAKVWFDGEDVMFRPILAAAYPAPWSQVVFEADEQGVSNARVVIVDGAVQGLTIPYSAVQVVAFDGRRVRRLGAAVREDFLGLQVEWKRSGPLPVRQR